MSTVIRDLVPAFLEFWEQASGLPEQRQLDLWNQYVARYPEVINDASRVGKVADPSQAMQRYSQLLERIQVNAPQVTRWITEAAELVTPVLQAQHLEVPCLSIVGLATSNGWVTELHGRHTLFLAVEQIPDNRSARILAAHECGHAFQLPLPDQPWPEAGPLGHGIYSEGFATALTAELLPEYGLSEHLWFGPGHDDWLAECFRVLPEAAAAIGADLESPDREVANRYLTLSGTSPYPPRIGYLVGTRALQELRRTYDWPVLARWSTDRAMDELAAVLAQYDWDCR